jgi:hypothetical protein
MTCQLCGRDAPLINAHIIPKPFFRTTRQKGLASMLVSNKAGERPKRSRTGVYDSHILCASCDRRIGVWDQYGVELFVHGLASFTPLSKANELIAFQQPSFDYARLRLFILSVLWRSHISSHPMFDRVRLGPHAKRLRAMIEHGQPGDSTDFSTVLSAFTLNGRLPNVGVPIADPFRERWHGVNAYRLSLGVVTAYVAVDQHPLPDYLRSIAVADGQPLLLVERDFASSSEARAVRSIARAPQNTGLFKKR